MLRGPDPVLSQVGRGRHLKLRLESKGTPLDAIFFSADGAELGLAPAARVDVAFYPQINEFRGTRSVQLQVAGPASGPHPGSGGAGCL